MKTRRTDSSRCSASPRLIHAEVANIICSFHRSSRISVGVTAGRLTTSPDVADSTARRVPSKWKKTGGCTLPSSRAHEARGFDLFANTSGTAMWNTMKNFKALASTLLAKEMAIKNSNHAEAQKCRDWIEAIAVRASEQSQKASA